MAVDPAKIELALSLIEQGESENAACIAAGVNRGTFRSAVLRFGFADNYARATEALARDQVEKLETVIQEARDGSISPEIAKIEIDARKWIASKLFKPTWGDKVVQEHTGAGGGPIEVADARSRVADRLAALGGAVPVTPGPDKID